jgi:RNA polymerase sigma-70 factor, ECF subfamily
MSICNDRDCAQEAVQDAFLAMWSSRATYNPARGSAVHWAMSIVEHRAILLSRRRSTAARLSEGADHLAEQPAPDDVPTDFAARTDAKLLNAQLARLPQAQREVIKLGFYDGLTHQEIARQLALPPGTVKGRMRLGLNKLRTKIER